MADDFDRARELYLSWDKRAFSVLGVWPLEATYLKFSFWILYICIHTTMVLADLYAVFGNFELMITNLGESTLEVMTIVKLLVLRFSVTLKDLLTEIVTTLKPEHYKDTEEKKIYLDYNRIAKLFFKACLYTSIGTSFTYHLKSLENPIRSVFSNETLPYNLPYRTRLFFTAGEATTYWVAFIYQSPMIYIHMFHAMNIGVLFSLILHVCGELAVLAFRIRNLDIDQKTEPRHARLIFRDIVEGHIKLIGMAKAIDDTFCVLLLEELVTITIIVCLTAYNVIVNSDMANMIEFCSSLLYCVTMLITVYGYCVAGEFLITESLNVYNAYHECEWYDLPSMYTKQLTICMAATSKPLVLTGGHFYIFSMAGFMSVVKTSMAYVSMLRTVVAN